MERGQQFPYEIKYQWEPMSGSHLYTAHHKGQEVGHMILGEDGVVADVSVHKDHQRKGVATALWAHAVSRAGLPNDEGVIHGHPEHSGYRTPAGEAWAKSTGPQHYFPPEEIH